MEAPIFLIENTEDGKFVLNHEALKILSSFNQPLVVVSIVGMYRTGKSYLMNKLAGAKSGFNLGSTVQSKTKGIWMWCVPHPIEGNRKSLVLLDTEGLGDVEKGDNKNDICIFSLALLLSSVLVYNSKGTIDQNAINKLQFVGELSNLIKVKSKENYDEEAEYSSHFPMFIWAVRDFQLNLMIDGKTVTEDEYLENALKLKKPAKTIRDQDYNRVRQQLRMYFGKRKCFVFDLPTANKQHLVRLEEIPDSDLSADFVRQCQKFCDYIFSEGDVKSMKQIFAVTGPRLGELAKIYSEAINSSKAACMEEAVVSLADKENKMAVKEATQHYEDKMKKVVFPTETLSHFLDISRQYEDQARQIFLTKCFQDDDHQYLKEFVETINKQKKEFSFKNEAKSLEICGTLIKNLSVDFEKALAEGAYIQRGGHGEFKKDLKTIEIKYNNETGKGVKAEWVLQAYIKSKEGNATILLQQDNALTQRAKEEEEKKSRKQIKEMEEKMRQLDQGRIAQKANEDVTSIGETINQLKDKFNKEKKMMEEKIKQAIEHKQMEKDLYKQQGQTDQAWMYEEQIAELEKKLETLIEKTIERALENKLEQMLETMSEKNLKKKLAGKLEKRK